MADIFPNLMKTIIHLSKNFNKLLPQKKKKSMIKLCQGIPKTAKKNNDKEKILKQPKKKIY